MTFAAAATRQQQQQQRSTRSSGAAAATSGAAPHTTAAAAAASRGEKGAKRAQALQQPPPAAAAAANPVGERMQQNAPQIGSWISLVSVANIRYTGMLSSINYEHYTLNLRHVRSHGTEDREADKFIKPNPDIYPEVEFMAVNIVSLDNIEFSDDDMMVDPAILNIATNPKSMSLQSKSKSKESQETSKPLNKMNNQSSSDKKLNETSQTNSNVQLKKPANMKPTRTHTNNAADSQARSAPRGTGQNQYNNTTPSHVSEQKKFYNRNLRTNGMDQSAKKRPLSFYNKRVTYRNKPPFGSDTAALFDTESKDEFLKDSETINFVEPSPVIKIDSDVEQIVYDASKGFFDALEDNYDNKNWADARKQNIETFGKLYYNSTQGQKGFYKKRRPYSQSKPNSRLKQASQQSASTPTAVSSTTTTTKDSAACIGEKLESEASTSITGVLASNPLTKNAEKLLNVSPHVDSVAKSIESSVITSR
ncbi:MAG: Protein LSM14 A [Marteilia pararefringens]